eukprot:CAMPEP_0171799204 /NCGR_PEP_ID=MMETSP0991-20121206/70990_1 /TAXON_ID=483369 /ORGANISM="non described non described, Strain CCMP2098" /LENGTH=38 /DNA_ID= /DNA_START= /DNA_END= /DNA_ORIENTATION=
MGTKFYKVVSLKWPYVTVRYDDGDVEDLEATEIQATLD